MIQIPLSLESVCGCVPSTVADNLAILSELVGPAKADAIVKSTGFSFRRVAAPGTTVFDLAIAAARRALDGAEAASLGGIVAVSFSAPDRFPALSIRLHHALGLPSDAAALDLSLACSGYPYGLFAAAQLAAASGKRVLLVDGDVQSAHVDTSDVNTLAVMSDAATATLLAPGGEPASFAFLTDGAGADTLRCGPDGKIRMDGFGVFRFVAGPVSQFLKEFCATVGTPPDLFIPHQANMYMVRQLAKSLGLESQLCTSGERFANPGSCSVPLTLAATEGAGRALLAGFGAGLSAAAAFVDIPSTLRRSLVEA
jgi:3-oxoacyl-[acyl-carrier-protein] synthase-3